MGQWLCVPMVAAGDLAVVVVAASRARRRGRRALSAMRQIFLDTETTGLNAAGGDAIVEIGCIEMIDRRLTGNNRHYYLNPQRSSHPDALRVHGLSDEFLADKPRFADIADELLGFLAGAEIIMHNAAFDVGFLDEELRRCGRTGTAECVARRQRQPVDGARDVSRQEQLARRAVQAAGGRQQQPHVARRTARRRAAGRGLHRHDTRAGRRWSSTTSRRRPARSATITSTCRVSCCRCCCLPKTKSLHTVHCWPTSTRPATASCCGARS